MSEGGGPRMLRMVRWQSMMQDAERLRNWQDQDLFEALSRTIHMGDPDSARQALVEWVQERRLELERQGASKEKFILLRAMFYEFRSKILGRSTVMDTELGYHAINVGPEFDKSVTDFDTWASRGTLRRIFDEGWEVIVTGHMGTGKSHLAVKLMEYLLDLIRRPQVYILTNISGVEDTSGKYGDRIFHVSRLSEILRIWTELPNTARTILVLDEPEANLRGGSSRSVRTFSDFRNMLRKMRMSKLEIWHSEGEIYKSLREEDSEQVTRITKTEKTAFTVASLFQGKTLEQHVQGVEDLEFLRYAHRGMASIDIDVVMQRIMTRLGKATTTEEQKKAVREALEDPAYYVREYRDVVDVKAEPAGLREDIIQHVLRDPLPYLTAKRHVDHSRLRREFGLTVREAEATARETTRRWREATPNWEDIRPLRPDRPTRPSRRRGNREDGEDDSEE